MAAATSPSLLSAVLLTVAALLPAEPAAQSVSPGRLSADLVRKVEQVAKSDVSSDLKTAICRGNSYGWLDCELTMVVCVLDVVLE
jgi:sulfite exporter TauE/SafE